MADASKPASDDEVDQILLNARLRDELEPYLDESVQLIDLRRFPTRLENEFLASMLEWERAPVLPISRWFEPELILPAPDTLDDQRLNELLWNTIHQLYSQRIALDFTEHLSDRDLYRLIYRDILPSLEKKIDRSSAFLHWYCLDASDNPEIWLTYYATDTERQQWQEETGGELPPSQPTPFPRRMPRRPL